MAANVFLGPLKVAEPLSCRGAGDDDVFTPVIILVVVDSLSCVDVGIVPSKAVISRTVVDLLSWEGKVEGWGGSSAVASSTAVKPSGIWVGGEGSLSNSSVSWPLTSCKVAI